MIIREEPDWHCTWVPSSTSHHRGDHRPLIAGGEWPVIGVVPQVHFGSTMRWSAAGYALSQVSGPWRCIRAGGSTWPPRLSWSPFSPGDVVRPSRYVGRGELARRARTHPDADQASRPSGETLGSWAVILSGVQIPAAGGDRGRRLVVPQGAAGVVVFAHGSGSSRHSPRNRMVAARLQAGVWDC